MSDTEIEVDWDYEITIRDEKIEKLTNELAMLEARREDLKQTLINVFNINPDPAPVQPAPIQSQAHTDYYTNEEESMKLEKEQKYISKD